MQRFPNFVGDSDDVIAIDLAPLETSGNRLLPQRQVRRAFDQVLHEQVIRTLLHHSTRLHGAIEFEAGFCIGYFGFCNCGRNLAGAVSQ